MKKLLFFISITSLIWQISFAQQTVTTQNGKEVQLNADGTWQYVNTNVNIDTNTGKCIAYSLTGKKCTEKTDNPNHRCKIHKYTWYDSEGTVQSYKNATASNYQKLSTTVTTPEPKTTSPDYQTLSDTKPITTTATKSKNKSKKPILIKSTQPSVIKSNTNHMYSKKY